MNGGRTTESAGMSRDGTTARGGPLDALRFLAAFFVVVFHYGDEAPVLLDTLHSVFFRGYLATDFFLMLSGYVLGLAYGAAVEEGRIATPQFLARRIARIWPGHLVVLGLMAALVAVSHLAGLDPHHPGRFNWPDRLPQALLVQAWADVGGGGWNLPSWSLSALIISYAGFPFLWRGLRRLTPLVGVALTAAIVIAGHLICLRVLGRGLFDLPFPLGALRAAPLFALGASLACVTKAQASSNRISGRISGGVALAATATFLAYQLFVPAPSDTISIAWIALIIVSAGSVGAVRSSRMVEAAGRLSFALFITHILAAMVWFGVIHAIGPLSVVQHWLAWVVSLPFALLLAYQFDWWIDQPLQAWLKPRLARAFQSAKAGRSSPAAV